MEGAPTGGTQSRQGPTVSTVGPLAVSPSRAQSLTIIFPVFSPRIIERQITGSGSPGGCGGMARWMAQ
ncbi:hypothetical protein AQJ58_36470 [Streptomyces sp. DSM 15324]|nr:hypothetical protein AQJ58_36470 [Streptomyces sp. DSM 15324]